MHAGEHSGAATGKRGRPPNSSSQQKNININRHTIYNPLQNVTSLKETGKTRPDRPPHFLDSMSTPTRVERVKSPLSEIRARELMLAENVVHHNSGLPLDVAQRVMDTHLRPRLIHPASQVLALPPHIPLTQDSASSFSSKPVIEEPIVIEDDPVIDNESSFEEKQLQSSVESVPQVQVDKTMMIPNDAILPDAQQSPVIVASTNSPDVIPIHVPPMPPQNQHHHQEDSGFSCIVNNSLAASQLGHKLVEKEAKDPTTSSESSLIFPKQAPSASSGSSLIFPPQQIPTNASGIDLAATTKVHQKQPLVLEIENSNIGLYLHLDLSKFICEAAQKWLSRHTQECTGVCRANFPLNTSNVDPDIRAPSVETELKEAPEVLPTPSIPLPTPSIPIPTPSIPMSTGVSTISKAPSIIPSSKNQAFPTAILAVPQALPTVPQALPANGETEEHSSTKHHDLSIFNKSNLPEKNLQAEPVIHVPHIQPVIMNSVKHSSSNAHDGRIHRNKTSSVQEPPASGEQSLIFQRWPTLRQYMQVRCLANNQKEFSCYKCGKQFQELHQLKVHVKNHIKRYNCTQCHYSTHRMANLKRHQLTHRQVNELTCQVCSAVLGNKRSYTMHVLFAHKKQRARSKDFDTWRKQFALSAGSSSAPEVKMGVVPAAQSSMDQQTNGDSITGRYTGTLS